MAFLPGAVRSTLYLGNTHLGTVAAVFTAVCSKWGKRHYDTGFMSAAATAGPGKKLQPR